MRNYKFRLYPNDSQEYKLNNNLNVCKWVYNKFVEQAQKNFISQYDMQYMLTELKQSEPWLYNYHSKMLQSIASQVAGAEKALKALSKNGHKSRQLKFARYNEYRTFTYNQSGYKFERHGEKYLLYLSKIGYIEIRKSREPQGKIKQVVVTRTKSNKWFVSVTCDIKDSTIIHIPKHFPKAVGIDIGIKNFTYDSDGHSTPNPLNLKKLLKPLARVQRKISRRIKGSNNRLKSIRHLQRIHEKIVNKRNDFQHKLSTVYAKNNDIIFVEKLEINNMVKNHKLARSIMDSSWNSFLQKLEYKCKMMIKVSPRNTTIDCSKCGSIVSKTLAIRTHECNVCGLKLDRDYNASLNILKKGLEEIDQSSRNDYQLLMEHQEVTLVEMPMVSMKQENPMYRYHG